MATRKQWAILLGIIALGLTLRMIGIDKSLYRDEFFTLYWPQQGLRFLWTTGFAEESNPPLYYTLILFWTRLFSSSEITLRLLGIIASAATIPMVFLIGAKLFRPSTGLIAAAFFAANSIDVLIAGCARSYPLQGFFASLCVYGMIEFFISPSKGRGAAIYLIGAVALAYTHYTLTCLLAALTLGGFAFSLIFSWRDGSNGFRLAQQWLGLSLVVLAATAPEISFMLAVSKTASLGLLKVPMAKVPDYTLYFLSGVMESHVATLLSVALGFAVLHSWKTTSANRQLTRLVLIIIPGIFIFILIVGNIWTTLFHPKALTVLYVGISVLLANWIESFSSKKLCIALFVGITACYLFTPPDSGDQTPYREMFSSLPVQDVAVVFGPRGQSAALGYYRPDVAKDSLYSWNGDDMFPEMIDDRLWKKLFPVKPVDTNGLAAMIADHKTVCLVTYPAIYYGFAKRLGRPADKIVGTGIILMYVWSKQS